MNPRVQQFVASMDDKNWFRVVVGFGPGLILGKLASQVGSTNLEIASGVLLAAGMGVYLAWPMIRAKVRQQLVAEDELEQDVGQNFERPVSRVPGKSDAAAMAELVDLCGGRAASALEMIEVELNVDPEQTYSGALDRALRRQRLFDKRT